jgi:hypothetical protein
LNEVEHLAEESASVLRCAILQDKRPRSQWRCDSKTQGVPTEATHAGIHEKVMILI